MIALINYQLNSTNVVHPFSSSDFASLSRFFLAVCGWSFVVANLWGVARKYARVDAAFIGITGRSWYPSVTVEFFKHSLNAAVRVETPEMRYLGVLISAPDTADGEHIILRSVAVLPRGEPGTDPRLEPLPLVEEMLIKIDHLTSMQLLKPTVLKKKEVDDGNKAS